MEETKRCPYCGEKILAVAKKCKHCGEWLEIKETEKEKKACPVCGELVDSDINVCPYCKEFTHFNEGDNDDRIVNNTPDTREDKVNKRNKLSFNNTLPLICGCIIAACILGIKMCEKEKRHKEHVEWQKKQAQQWGDAFKQHDEEAFRILTKSSWYGKNSISEHHTEDGWNIIINGVLDSKKTYMNNKEYTENGTLSVNITCTNASLKWKGEGEIKIIESGVITDFGSVSMTEKMTKISGEIVATRIVYNNTEADNEDLAMNVRLMLNEIVKTAQNSDKKSTYHIKTLTDTSLVLEEGNILEPTGVKLTYKRNI